MWQWSLCYIGCKGNQNNNNNKTQCDGPHFITQMNSMAIIVVLPKEIKILKTCNMVMATMLLHIITKFSKKATDIHNAMAIKQSSNVVTIFF